MTDHRSLIDAYIAENLSTFTLRLHDASDWDASADTLHAPFGFAPPIVEEGGDCMLDLCPELIARQVAHLDDEERVESYLLFVEMHINLHLIHHGMPTDELERLIDRVAYDSSPLPSSWATEIQAKAMESA